MKKTHYMIHLEPSGNLAGRPRVGCFLEMTEPLPGKKPAFALLRRLLCAAAFVLPAAGAQSGVVFSSLYAFQLFFGFRLSPMGKAPNPTWCRAATAVSMARLKTAAKAEPGTYSG